MESFSPRCFSQRMLNPYHGIVSVIEIDGADAVTRDGLHWTLYVKREQQQRRLQDGSLVQMGFPDAKYGVWSARNGLRRAPIRSVEEYPSIEKAGERLRAIVEEKTAQLPFPLADHFELWLLDRDELPLALLNSATDIDNIEPEKNPQFHIGERCRRYFRVEELNHKETSACELVTQIFHQACGKSPRAQWFRRNADGAGTPLLINADRVEPLPDATAANRFPRYPVRDQWRDPVSQKIIHRYIEWLAPWLLQLQSITTPQRIELEAAAFSQAKFITNNYRLYPEVIDGKRLRSSLVEARLTIANILNNKSGIDPLSPYHVES